MASVGTTVNQSLPVFKLHHDLLWYIFTLNTPEDIDFSDLVPSDTLNEDSDDDFIDDPMVSTLTTTRYSSQVCHLWRRLILGSPSLWADSIELPLLGKEDIHWREEVLRRAGDAPLSIVSVVSEFEPITQTSVFLSLISDHWSRIRRLKIFPSILSVNVANDPRWLTLQRPAPRLEIFSISLYIRGSDGLAANTVFAHNAPSLRSFAASGLVFKLPGLWLSQIRRLSLDGGFSGCEVLQAFREMTLLEFLEIRALSSPTIHDDPSDWPNVILPSLRELIIINSPDIFVPILAHLQRPSNCSLTIESTGGRFAAEELQTLGKTLSNQLSSYFDPPCKTTALWCNVQKNYFIAGSLSGLPFFHITLGVYYERLEDIPRTIIQSLASCNLSNVTSLDLDSAYFVSMDSSDPTIHSFFKSLVNVLELQTDFGILKLLNDIDTNDSVYLPLLHTIRLERSHDLESHVVIHFLIQRRKAGTPIKTFDVLRCFHPVQKGLLFLNNIDGLEVVGWWRSIREEMIERRLAPESWL